jgi:hypothetical protein
MWHADIEKQPRNEDRHRQQLAQKFKQIAG